MGWHLLCSTMIIYVVEDGSDRPAVRPRDTGCCQGFWLKLIYLQGSVQGYLSRAASGEPLVSCPLFSS